MSGNADDRITECPLILAGVMSGKSGYSSCRRTGCAWWDRDRWMCCIAAAAARLAEKKEETDG